MPKSLENTLFSRLFGIYTEGSLSNERDPFFSDTKFF
jgi:hypothetical protein